MYQLIQILLNGLVLLLVLSVNSVAFVGTGLQTTRTNNQTMRASLNISNRNLRDSDKATGGAEEAEEEADEDNEGDQEDERKNLKKNHKLPCKCNYNCQTFRSSREVEFK